MSRKPSIAAISTDRSARPASASLGRTLLLALPLLSLFFAALAAPNPAAAQFQVQGCREVWTGDPGTLGTTRECYYESNLRPVHPLTDCRPGTERNGALCYPLCREGYTGNGPLCWQDCPAGYTDDGATCRRNAMIISADNSACPWYDRCGLTLRRGCSKCPDGYQNDGCTCRIDVHIFGQDTYGRGVGESLQCAPGRERIGALCYDNCPAGTRNTGISCTDLQQTCVDIPNQPPAPPQNPYCFLRRQASSVDPCRPFLQYASSEENARQILQNCDCSNCTFESVSCGDYLNACTPKPMKPMTPTHPPTNPPTTGAPAESQ